MAGRHTGRLGDQVRGGATCDLRGIVPLLHLLNQLHRHPALACVSGEQVVSNAGPGWKTAAWDDLAAPSGFECLLSGQQRAYAGYGASELQVSDTPPFLRPGSEVSREGVFALLALRGRAKTGACSGSTAALSASLPSPCTQKKQFNAVLGSNAQKEP